MILTKTILFDKFILPILNNLFLWFLKMNLYIKIKFDKSKRKQRTRLRRDKKKK